MRDGSGDLIAPRQVRAGIPAHLDEVAMVLLRGEPHQLSAEMVAVELGGGEAHGDSTFLDDDGTLSFTSYDRAHPAPVNPPTGGRNLLLGVAILVAIAIVGVFAASWIFSPGGVGTGSSGTGVTGSPGQQASNQPTPIKVASARVVDPEGDRTELADAGHAVDGSMTTDWGPDHYNTAQFGNIKKGMGLLLDLGEPRSVSQVTVRLSTPHSSLELRGGDSDPGPTADGDKTVADAFQPIADPKPDAQTTAVFTLPGDGKVRYLLFWITKLPPDNQGKFYVGVQEITVSGQ
jgi:hypothetical protein